MKKGLNANHLKLLAIVAMTVDHIADLLFPGFPAEPLPVLLHIIGRLTAPIMWFFLCEGFFYTKNIKKYLIRMFCFAAISHFAYCFAFGIPYLPYSTGNIFNQTSVIWALAWALAALWIIHGDENIHGNENIHGKHNLKQWQKYVMLTLICLISFSADWSCIAVMAVVAMYSNRGSLPKQMRAMMIWVLIYAVVSFFCVNKVYGIITLFAFLVYFPLRHYNGQKGKAGWMKWLFYVYYPAHLVVIGIFRLVMYGNLPLLF